MDLIDFLMLKLKDNKNLIPSHIIIIAVRKSFQCYDLIAKYLDWYYRIDSDNKSLLLFIHLAPNPAFSPQTSIEQTILAWLVMGASLCTSMHNYNIAQGRRQVGAWNFEPYYHHLHLEHFCKMFCCLNCCFITVKLP